MNKNEPKSWFHYQSTLDTALTHKWNQWWLLLLSEAPQYPSSDGYVPSSVPLLHSSVPLLHLIKWEADPWQHQVDYGWVLEFQWLEVRVWLICGMKAFAMANLGMASSSLGWGDSGRVLDEMGKGKQDIFSESRWVINYTMKINES